MTEAERWMKRAEWYKKKDGTHYEVISAVTGSSECLYWWKKGEYTYLGPVYDSP